jgi:hypothetical protein
MPSREDYRERITRAIGPTLSMHRMDRPSTNGASLYVGAWASWSNDESRTPTSLKVLFATIESTGGAVDDIAPLSVLPWVILQFQTLQNDHFLWESVMALVKEDLAGMIRSEEPASTRCPTKLSYDPTQKDHGRRTFEDLSVLQEYVCVRQETLKGPMPARFLTRDRVLYAVYVDTEEGRVAQPMRVFLERATPKNQGALQRMQSDSGFNKEGTLHSAIEEWHTWLILD